MTTTSVSTHLINDNSEDSSALRQIKSWIDANMLSTKEGTIWRIGVACSEDIMKIQAEVMSDMESKHLRSWRLETFRDAVDTLTTLCKYPFIFKSPHHHYEGKGQYLFAYKIPCPYKQHFYHVLHS